MARQADGTIYINTAIGADGFKAGGKEVEAAARRMAGTISDIGDSAKTALQKQLNAFSKQNQAYARQEQNVQDLKEKIQSLSKTKIATDEFKELEKQIAADTKRLNQLEKTQEMFLAVGGKTKSSAFKKREMEIEELRESIRYAKGEQQELLDSGKAYKPADTSGTREKLDAEEEKLLQMNNALGTSYEALKAKIGSLGGDVARALNQSGQSVGFLQSMLNGLKMAAHAPISAVKALGGALAGLPHKALDLVASGLKKVGDAAKSAVQTIGKKLVSGLKNAAASMLGLNKSTKQSNNMFGISFKTILKYGFGIRSLYILVRKLRAAIKEGFTNLAQYDSTTNASISSLMSALTQLKNSLATAFAPILNVVAPIITAFINMISRAVTYVGMFVAALTGQKTFTKAVPVQQDYAASLGNTADAARDAADATQEATEAAEGYLSPIDEINKYDSGDKDKSGSPNATAGVNPGGYTAPSPADMFETVPINSALQGLADKIRGFIQSEDWEGLGSFIADGLNKGMEKIKRAISWENVGPTVTHFVDAFARTFNSLVDKLDWDLLGRTIGTGINTVVNTLNLLIEKINWVNLGKKLSEGVNGLVDEVDWGNFGRLLGNKFMILPNIVLGFVRNLKWDAIGQAIGDALNGVFNVLDFGVLGEILGRSLTGIFDIAINFASTFNWKKLGDNVANGINQFFANFDGAKFAQAATALLSGLLDMIIQVATTTDWTQIWRSIIDFLVNVDWLELLMKLQLAAWNLVSGIVSGLINAIAKTNWKDVWDRILQAFRDFFEIASPSAVMERQGVYLMEGLYNGILSLVDMVISIFTNIKDNILHAWENIRTDALTAWNGIKSSLATAWTGIKTAAKSQFDSIKTTIDGVWNNLRTSASQIWQGIKSDLSQALDGMFSSASRMGEKIKDVLMNAFKSLYNYASDILGNLVDLVSNLVQKIVDAANSIEKESSSSKSSSSSSSKKKSTKKAALPYNFPVLPTPTSNIPHLATGAVIPPNAPFMAVLGDQRRGYNLEAPESLIRRIIREETAQNKGDGNTYSMPIIISGRKLFEIMIDEAVLRQIRSGKNPFRLGEA